MFRTRIVRPVTAMLLALAMTAGVSAAEVESGEVLCFTREDFASEEPLRGICITATPPSGTVALGSRVIRSGDILTADQLEKLTFTPLETSHDLEAVISYLPIYENRVDHQAVTAISIHGKVDEVPVAEDSTLETYKNLENQGRLKVSDPEGGPLTYSLIRAPRRGSVEIREDGTFLYTPKKNKVGVDSFTYTASDEGGNVSREATVTVQIFKTSDRKHYDDTASASCRFTAEWMRRTGIFSGEQVGENLCFSPDRTVSRGEFLAMVMDTLNLETDPQAVATVFTDDTPQWLTPYLASAVRYGIVTGYPRTDGPVFMADQPVTGAEAASMIRNALNLPQTVSAEEDASWETLAVSSVQDQGIGLKNSPTLTRAEAADVLYQVSRLNQQLPEA